VTSLSSSIGRVPNALASRLALGNINRTSVGLLRVQSQIVTGRDLLRPSDDIVRATTIGVLDDRMERGVQVRRNLEHAAASIGTLDSIFGEASGLANQAKSIASSQLAVTSSAAERNGQASVVRQMLQSLADLANRESVAGFALGGSQTTRRPFEEHLGGFRYTGIGSGLLTDLGGTSGVPITAGEGNPLTGLVSRVRGSVDLNPALTPETRLSDLAGGRGLGVSLGPIDFSFGGGPLGRIELSGADTAGEVAARIGNALRRYEADNGVTVLGPGGVDLAGGGLRIDVVGGTPAPELRFFEVGTAVTARDLGLTAETPFAFASGAGAGVDLEPGVTWRTPVAGMAGVSGALGSILVENGGRKVALDLSSAETLEDVRNLIEGAGLGVRVVINEDATGIDVVNELSAGSGRALSIGEVAGSGGTASRLGIRTMDASTRLSGFNFGKGVSIVDGVKDPTTGLVGASLNTDFTIAVGDAAGTVLTIDLTPQDVVSIASLMAAVNAQASAQLTAAGLPSDTIRATLADGPNGISLVRTGTFPGTVVVVPVNNSQALADLGLMDGTWDPASATLTGVDRARVRVESLFTHLIDLREALLRNDVPGIALAGEGMDGAIDGLTDFRGLIGSHGQRVDEGLTREEDRAVLDEGTRSTLRDVDFATAATTFSLLQTQLEAGLRVTALAGSRTMLDYL